MNFTACVVAVCPRPRWEVGTDIRAKAPSRYSAVELDPFRSSSAAGYHHAKVLGLLTVVGSPDGLQQFFVRKRFALLSDEKSQHREFFGTEMDALAAHVHCPVPNFGR